MATPRRSRRRLRNLLRDERGTATTETVIMLPFFILVWGLIFYVFDYFHSRIEHQMWTRRHAWRHAYTGCESDGSYGRTSMDETGGFDGEGFVGHVDDVLSVLPGFHFDEIRANRTATVNRPEVIGGGGLTHEREMYLLCNEVPHGANLFSAVADYFGIGWPL